jgi:hypothetical protein
MISAKHWQVHYYAYLLLGIVAIFSLLIKLNLVGIGGPYTTIDDYTMFEGGFLVWFGQAPPQRMYLESWLSGLTSIAVYVWQLCSAGELHKIGINLIADAYRSFYENPDPFVKAYRVVSITVDFITAAIVFLLARTIFAGHRHWQWLAAGTAMLFLLSFNTLWCDLVARPDTATTFFTAIGLYFYYQSDFGKHPYLFGLCAMALGAATGFKLHAAFFIVFIIIDLWRISGFKDTIKKSAVLCIVSFAIFLLIAGSPLFDPLLYVKLRLLNIKDDESPWIHWGSQLVVMLRGTGWLVIPLIASVFLFAKRNGTSNSNSKINSVIFLAFCWLLLFAAIRQLRAYWMLPALPLFYCAGMYALTNFHVKIAIPIGIILIGVFSWQFISQRNELALAQHNELREWVIHNVKPDEPIYIIGYELLSLPKNTLCISKQRQGLEHLLTQSIVDNEPFAQRHARLWEERSALMLMDMLNNHSNIGYEYYTFNNTPLAEFSDIIHIDEMKYIIVQQNFHFPGSNELFEKIKNDFTHVTQVNAPGGKNGTRGQPVDIYIRK